MKIQKRTIRRLRAAASKLWVDEEYYTFIGTNYQVDSTLDMTEAQAEEAIGIIDRELNTRKKREHGRRPPGMLTNNQKEYIEGLFKEMGWDEGPRWTGWFKKITGKQCSINMLTNREASKVITGLERMVWDKFEGEYPGSTEHTPDDSLYASSSVPTQEGNVTGKTETRMNN